MDCVKSVSKRQQKWCRLLGFQPKKWRIIMTNTTKCTHIDTTAKVYICTLYVWCNLTGTIRNFVFCQLWHSTLNEVRTLKYWLSAIWAVSSLNIERLNFAIFTAEPVCNGQLFGINFMMADTECFIKWMPQKIMKNWLEFGLDRNIKIWIKNA